MSDLRFDVVYPHPPAKVWRALTTPELLAEWLMENDFAPAVGHRFTLRSEPAPGWDGVVHCEVLELQPERTLAFSWKGGPLDTVARFELEPTSDGGTRLRFVQSGFTGVKARLVRMILKSGSRRIYHRVLPELLARLRDDGTLAPAAVDRRCDDGAWRVWADLGEPILAGHGPRPARLIVATLIGGVLMFGWSAASWMALPLHGASLRNFPVEPAQADALLGRFTEPGVYHYPGFPTADDDGAIDDSAVSAAFDRMRAGPTVTLMVVHPGGREPLPPARMAASLALNVLASGVIVLLLARAGLATFVARWLFVSAFGLFALCAQVGPAWLWWGYAPLFGAAEALDALAAPALAGLAIAAIVRPSPPQTGVLR